jgi:hypothetical protein
MKASFVTSLFASVVALSAAAPTVAEATFRWRRIAPVVTVPELDPSATGSVIALVLAAALLLSHRRGSSAAR